jgi:hypothetical protein
MPIKRAAPGLTRMLAHEVKRHAGTGTLNLTELRKFLEEREAAN